MLSFNLLQVDSMCPGLRRGGDVSQHGLPGGHMVGGKGEPGGEGGCL